MRRTGNKDAERLRDAAIAFYNEAPQEGDYRILLLSLTGGVGDSLSKIEAMARVYVDKRSALKSALNATLQSAPRISTEAIAFMRQWREHHHSLDARTEDLIRAVEQWAEQPAPAADAEPTDTEMLDAMMRNRWNVYGLKRSDGKTNWYVRTFHGDPITEAHDTGRRAIRAAMRAESEGP